MCEGEVPAWGYAYLRTPCTTSEALAGGANWLENEAYRVEVDPQSRGTGPLGRQSLRTRPGRVLPWLAPRASTSTNE